MNATSNRHRISDHTVIYARGKKKRYTAEIHVPGSRRIKRGLGTTNKKAAIQIAMKKEAELLTGNGSGAMIDRVPLEQAVAEFLEAKRADRKAAKTVARYQCELDRLIHWCRGEGIHYLDQLRPLVHDRYRAHRGVGLMPSTLYNVALLAKTFTKWCESRELIATDPLRKVVLKEPPRDEAFCPSIDQVRAILEQAAGLKRVVLATLAFTGLRVGELLRLRGEDVDCDQGWIHVVSWADAPTKTGLSRRVPIHPVLAPLLERIGPRPKESAFFTDSEGSPPNWRHPNEWIQGIGAELGMPVGRPTGSDHQHRRPGLVAHSLRHFFRTHVMNVGVPIYLVDLWMGHGRIDQRGGRILGQVASARLYYHAVDDAAHHWMAQIDFGPSLVTDPSEVAS